MREAVAAGRADYTPIFLSEIEKLFWSGEMPLDVALMQTVAARRARLREPGHQRRLHADARRSARAT